MSDIEQAIARDLEKCDLGMALTTGRERARYAAHKRACLRKLHEMNEADGLCGMSDAELLAALAEPVTPPPALDVGPLVEAYLAAEGQSSE